VAPASGRRGTTSATHAAGGAVDASRPIYAVKADLFRVLGHPTRVRIIELLRDGERSVGSLQGSLGLDSSGTSQHLALLRRHGLVEGRRDGTTVHYRVTESAVFDLLEAARILLGRVLARQRAELDDLAGSLSVPGAADPASDG
jgi:DNA-binding transcriptional ArsR family regulator